jgi:inorganic phosphate transporter, PiT family
MNILLVVVVVAALLFDYTNGFHDSANAVATAISTRALTPARALTLAAILNVIGALLSTTVATTIAKGIVEPGYVTLTIVLTGLLGAIFWNLLTWYFGIPCSSSHCLVGGIAGSVAVGYGLAGVKWMGIFYKVIIPTVASPVLGFLGGSVLTVIISWVFRRANPGTMNYGFRRAQLASSSFLALSHGLNDAQKTMGIIALALFASGSIATPDVPTWVKFACAFTMGLGTFVGGKRIIRTLGVNLVKMTPVDGFTAQVASSVVLQGAAFLGCPISTTHVATTTIMGVGATHRLQSVRWGVTRKIILAWVLTLPASAFVGGGLTYVLSLFGLR